MYSYFLLVCFAFLLEVVDASVGMGYGTILTPALLLIGYDSLRVVPAVLISQLAGDFLAAFFHHKLANVNLSTKSKHLRVAMTFALLSLIGATFAVVISVHLPKPVINLYIGSLLVVTGLIVLATNKKRRRGFSWGRVLCLGSLAAFNKGISGGGYGPLVTSGQVLAGVDPKNAIGVVSFTEGVACLGAVLMYGLIGGPIDWALTALLSIGVLASAPIAAVIVRKMNGRRLTFFLGLCTFAIGVSLVLRAYTLVMLEA